MIIAFRLLVFCLLCFVRHKICCIPICQYM